MKGSFRFCGDTGNLTLNKGKFFCVIPCGAWVCIFVRRIRAKETSSASERVVRNPGWAELRLLAVLPSVRGHGVGALLVQECIRRAQINGDRAIGLHTKDEKHSAVRLYERLGFTRFQDLDFSPASGVLIKGYCYHYDKR